MGTARMSQSRGEETGKEKKQVDLEDDTVPWLRDGRFSRGSTSAVIRAPSQLLLFGFRLIAGGVLLATDG